MNIDELIKSIKKRDPAASNYLEIILLYPGLHAVFFHRVAHLFWIIKLNFIAKIIAYISRMITGIEIHPAAQIGKKADQFCKKVSNSDSALLKINASIARTITV